MMIIREKALAALQAWGISQAHSLEELSPEKVFRVRRANGDDLILKLVGEGAHERLDLQFDLLRHLASQGVPVAVPLRARDGQQTVDIEGTRFTLSPCLISDDDPKPGKPEDLIRSYGKAFAQLHVSLANYPNLELAATTWKNDPLGEFLERSSRCTAPQIRFQMNNKVLPTG